MKGKFKLFLGIVLAGLVFTSAGFFLDKVVYADPRAGPQASPTRKDPVWAETERKSLNRVIPPTPTLHSFTWRSPGNVLSVELDPLNSDILFCNGEDFSSCVLRTDVLRPTSSKKVYDCEANGHCREVPFHPLGEYKFLATTAPP
jgi:hypothetical protein